MKNSIFGLAAMFALIGSAFADSMSEGKALVLKNRDGLAIQGYDPVAYFTDNKPVKGSPKYQSEFEGARYWFVSPDHKTT